MMKLKKKNDLEYLKKYGFKGLEIQNLTDRYNQGIIKFMEENEAIVTDIIEYLYSEKIKAIYALMMNNIKIFLETQLTLKVKIEDMKSQGLNVQEIQMKLLQGK